MNIRKQAADGFVNVRMQHDTIDIFTRKSPVGRILR